MNEQVTQADRLVDEALLDKAVRAYFEFYPIFAHSVALAELCDTQVGEPIAFDTAIAAGFDVTGTRSMIAAAIPTIQKNTIAAVIAQATSDEAVERAVNLYTSYDPQGPISRKSAMRDAIIAALSGGQ